MFSQIETNGFVSGGLARGLTARVAARYEYRDGWQKGYGPTDRKFKPQGDDRLGDRRFATGRVLLDWETSDRVKFELNFNGWRDTSDTQAQQYVRFAAQAPLTPFNAYIYDALEDIPAVPASNRYAGWDAGKKYRRDDWFYQISLRGDLDIGDQLRLTSISNYDRYSQDSFSDIDGTAFLGLDLRQAASIKSFSQELRLAGDHDRLQWMIGGNYSRDKTDENQLFLINSTNASAAPVQFHSTYLKNRQNIDTYAVFGSVEYELASTLTLSGSARYTKQDRGFIGCASDAGDGEQVNFMNAIFGVSGQPGECITLADINPPFTIADGGVRRSLNEDNVSWRANISWKPTSDMLLYSNVTKGYKAGSFPVAPAIFAPQYVPATQESILAYEGGFKLSAVNRRVQLDGAAFYYEYNDKQLLGTAFYFPFGNLPQLVNIPKSRVYGAELQATVWPVDGLRLSMGATYVNSRVQADPTNPVDQFGASTTFVGENFPNTPKWQLTGDAEYRFPLGSGSEFYVGGNVAWRSKAWSTFGENEEFSLPSYALLDLRAGMSFDDGLDLKIWARNVTNKYYYVNVGHLIDSITRMSGMPATYGVTLSYRY